MTQTEPAGGCCIIGGSGLQSLSILNGGVALNTDTPYGKPSGAILRGRVGGADAFFLPRHGVGHTIPPHLINYRANIWAIRHHGATQIISVASVGGIQEALPPGTIVIPSQIIDYTWGRPSTFVSEGEQVTHIDFTQPFSTRLREVLLSAALACNELVVDGGVYAATQGPRLESAAEIDRIERDGGNIVGMTGMPEAALARELHLEYAMIAVVVNAAAGRGESKQGIRLSEIYKVTQQAMQRVETLLHYVLST
jgi:5'-deoxy-5'-methylthioadenosine phosphorylase